MQTKKSSKSIGSQSFSKSTSVVHSRIGSTVENKDIKQFMHNRAESYNTLKLNKTQTKVNMRKPVLQASKRMSTVKKSTVSLKRKQPKVVLESFNQTAALTQDTCDSQSKIVD